jgi:predicted N-acetyltransferase YhbS/catechol 2,3-dioxygenase-like lactoylglutathione lyase family enzyme
MALKLQTLKCLVINVENVAISAYWYQRTLGIEREDYSPRPGLDSRTTLKLGRQRIELRPVSQSPREWITADHRTTGSQSLCFETALRPHEIVEHLTGCGVKVVAGPAQGTGANSRLTSVFCRDPDGNLIEISSRRSSLRVEVRPERGDEAVAIRRLVQDVFLSSAQARLIDRLRHDGDILVALVATADRSVLGTAVFSCLSIVTRGKTVEAAVLAPLAVHRDHRGLGIGSALVNKGLQICTEHGKNAVIAFGSPLYYTRLGFSAELANTLKSKHSPPDVTAIELTPGALRHPKTTVKYPSPFGAVG